MIRKSYFKDPNAGSYKPEDIGNAFEGVYQCKTEGYYEAGRIVSGMRNGQRRGSGFIKKLASETGFSVRSLLNWEQLYLSISLEDLRISGFSTAHVLELSRIELELMRTLITEQCIKSRWTITQLRKVTKMIKDNVLISLQYISNDLKSVRRRMQEKPPSEAEQALLGEIAELAEM